MDPGEGTREPFLFPRAPVTTVMGRCVTSIIVAVLLLQEEKLLEGGVGSVCLHPHGVALWWVGIVSSPTSAPASLWPFCELLLRVCFLIGRTQVGGSCVCTSLCLCTQSVHMVTLKLTGFSRPSRMSGAGIGTHSGGGLPSTVCNTAITSRLWIRSFH